MDLKPIVVVIIVYLWGVTVVCSQIDWADCGFFDECDLIAVPENRS